MENTGGGSIGPALLTRPSTWCKTTATPAGERLTSLQIPELPILHLVQLESAAKPRRDLTDHATAGVAAVPDASFLVRVSGTGLAPSTAAVLRDAPWLNPNIDLKVPAFRRYYARIYAVPRDTLIFHPHVPKPTA